MQKNDLSVCIPDAPGTDTIYDIIWDYQPDVAGKCSSPFITIRPIGSPAVILPILPDDQIIISVTNGVAYGEKYVEIYEGDCNRYPVGMTAAHNLLLGAP